MMYLFQYATIENALCSCPTVNKSGSNINRKSMIRLWKLTYMLIFRFIILFWVPTRIGLHASMLKNTSVISFCSMLQYCIPILSKTLCFSSCLFKTSWPPLLVTQRPPIGQLTHAWAGTANNNRSALLNSYLHTTLVAIASAYVVTKSQN